MRYLDRDAGRLLILQPCHGEAQLILARPQLLLAEHDAVELPLQVDLTTPEAGVPRVKRISQAQQVALTTLRGKLEPQDILQELAVKALHELPAIDLGDRDPFAWLCHLAEQCVVDGHRHFAAGKRATGREIAGNVPAGEGSQDLVALLAASLTSPTQAVVRDERTRRLHDVPNWLRRPSSIVPNRRTRKQFTDEPIPYLQPVGLVQQGPYIGDPTLKYL